MNRRDFLRITGISCAGIVVSTSLFSGCAGSVRSLRLGVRASPVTWNPNSALSSLNFETLLFYDAVFDRFIGSGAQTNLTPSLLTHWFWNNQKTELSMMVRDDAYWHDGAKVINDDVIQSLNRLRDPNIPNPFHFFWRKIVDLRSQNNRVIASFSEFDASAFRWLSHSGSFVLPSHLLDEIGSEGWNARPIGSGPYRVREFVPDSHLRLETHSKYWGQKPDFDSIYIETIPEERERIRKFQEDDVDLVVPVSAGVTPSLLGDSHTRGSIRAEDQELPVIGAISITSKHEVMKKRNIRLAMQYAIDKQALVDQVLGGLGTKIDTLQLSNYTAYDASINVDYDPQLARNLLSAERYSIHRPVQFKMHITQGHSPLDYEIGEAVVAMWKLVGIKADLEIYDPEDYFALIVNHDLEAATFSNIYVPTNDASISTGMAMASRSRFSTFKSAELDRLLLPLWTESEEGRRLEGYRKIDHYIMDEALIIPLFQYNQRVLHNNRVSIGGNTSVTTSIRGLQRS